MRNFSIRAYFLEEDGVVTVDWVVVAAGVLLGTVIFVRLIGLGAVNLVEAHSAPLAPITLTVGG